MLRADELRLVDAAQHVQADDLLLHQHFIPRPRRSIEYQQMDLLHAAYLSAHQHQKVRDPRDGRRVRHG